MMFDVVVVGVLVVVVVVVAVLPGRCGGMRSRLQAGRLLPVV